MSSTEAQKPNKSLGYGPIGAITVTLSTFFVSQFIAALILSLVPLALGWSVLRTEQWFADSVFAKFLTVLLISSATVGLLWLFLRNRKVRWKAIGWRPPKLSDLWAAVAGYAVYIAIFIAASIVVSALVPAVDFEQEQDLFFDRDTTGASLLLVFISLVTLAALVEEILFRGLMYTGLRSKWRTVPAAIVTSLLFAVLHLQVGSGAQLLWVAALDTFVLSLVLVYLREKTAGLSAPIMVHFIKNSLAFALVFLV